MANAADRVAVGLAHIRPDDGDREYHRVGQAAGDGIVDVLPADVRPGGRHTPVAEGQDFDDVNRVEWAADADTPGAALGIDAGGLEITAGLDIEILQPASRGIFTALDSAQPLTSPVGSILPAWALSK